MYSLPYFNAAMIIIDASVQIHGSEFFAYGFTEFFFFPQRGQNVEFGVSFFPVLRGAWLVRE